MNTTQRQETERPELGQPLNGPAICHHHISQMLRMTLVSNVDVWPISIFNAKFYEYKCITASLVPSH